MHVGNWHSSFYTSSQEQATGHFKGKLFKLVRDARKKKEVQLKCSLPNCLWGIDPHQEHSVTNVVHRILKHLGQNHLGKTTSLVVVLLCSAGKVNLSNSTGGDKPLLSHQLQRVYICTQFTYHLFLWEKGSFEGEWITMLTEPRYSV